MGEMFTKTDFSGSLPDSGSGRKTRRANSWLAAKRGVDLVVGLTLGVLTLPLQALLLAGSAISFRAFPIFSQPRVGLGGETFTFRKIRSLPTSAPSETDKYDLKKNVTNTRFGTFIRIAHLDELLQLWSVVAGDMSIVGPRPEMVGLSDSYDPEFVASRTSVRPGITGLWQVSAASQGLIGEAPEYDEYYVANASPRLDLWIAIKTVAKMARHEMIELADTPGFVGEPEALVDVDQVVDLAAARVARTAVSSPGSIAEPTLVNG